LLERQAGPDRARELLGARRIDIELLNALAAGGFLDLFREAGPLEAGLVVEEVQRSLGVVPLGARMLVAPALMDGEVPASVALMSNGRDVPVRYGAEAECILVAEGDVVRVLDRGDVEAVAVDSAFGLMARISVPPDAGSRLSTGSADVMLRWWSVAISLEASACMDVVLTMTLDYVRQRQVFGRALGSFQAVQHRLAEAFIAAEAAKWLAREAAFHDAEVERAATAAAFAAEAGKLVFDECHQFHGALGLTAEYSLHLWTTRLHALRVEMGGLAYHRSRVALAHWVP
jgi:hypothetical protein